MRNHLTASVAVGRWKKMTPAVQVSHCFAPYARCSHRCPPLFTYVFGQTLLDRHPFLESFFEQLMIRAQVHHPIGKYFKVFKMNGCQCWTC